MKTIADLSVTSAAPRARRGWHPGLLFNAGAQGAWFDPSRLPTLFQDAAGTVPVTGDGDPVGLMRDISGNGNHAAQPAPAARPTWRTDGTLSWLEFDGVDDALSIGPVPFAASLFGLCIGLDYDPDAGTSASWRSRDIISKYVGLSYKLSDGNPSDIGGTLTLNGAPAPTSRIALRALTEDPSVGCATEVPTAPFAGRAGCFFTYSSTQSPIGRFFGYVESEALTAALTADVTGWMAGKSGVTL